MEFADVFGYAGIFTGVSFMLPQVMKSLKTRSVADLSWGMLILFFFNCVFWLMYGILTGAVPVVVVNALSLAVAGAQILLKARYTAAR